MPTELVTAFIAAASGLGGALIGGWMAGRASRQAAEISRREQEADRIESRRARFAERVVDLAVEFTEEAQANADALAENWLMLRNNDDHTLPPGPWVTVRRLVMRLEMLLTTADAIRSMNGTIDALTLMEDAVRRVAANRLDLAAIDSWDIWHPDFEVRLREFLESMKGEVRAESSRPG